MGYAAWLHRFIRLTTSRKVVARPLSADDVTVRIESWLALPHIHLAQPSDTHFARLRAELERLGTAGNLTTDAHLAVLGVAPEQPVHCVVLASQIVVEAGGTAERHLAQQRSS